MRNQLALVAVLSGVTFLLSLYFEESLWEIGIYMFDYEIYNALLGGPQIYNTKIKLFIGIFSSPDHFRQRQSQRQTWLNLLPNTFQYRFVVGEKACSIHPLNRKSPYNCEDLNYTISENITEISLLQAYPEIHPDICEKNTDENIGFSFHVHHPIVVRYLGLKKNNHTFEKDLLTTVVIADLQKLETIVSVVFDKDSLLHGLNKSDYTFKRLKTPVILPKGFEGVIKVEGFSENIKVQNVDESAEWTHGNLISLLNIIAKNSSQTSTNYCGYATFSFTIKDFNKLTHYINGKQNRQSEWLQHVEETRTQLQYENNRYNDIIFMDIVDVYRNLPEKLLRLLQWVHKNVRAKYILKADDDTFIDLKRVEAELDKTSGWDWWSCFRVGWPVHRYGKWRESVYQQELYPPFPSGAGYVLSQRVVAWLNERINNLSTKYQGEDVALGIWLEGINMTVHVGSECYWACNEQCHPRTCNAMELSVNDVYKMWEDYQTCGNKICHCPHPP